MNCIYGKTKNKHEKGSLTYCKTTIKGLENIAQIEVNEDIMEKYGKKNNIQHNKD